MSEYELMSYDYVLFLFSRHSLWRIGKMLRGCDKKRRRSVHSVGRRVDGEVGERTGDRRKRRFVREEVQRDCEVPDRDGARSFQLQSHLREGSCRVFHEVGHLRRRENILSEDDGTNAFILVFMRNVIWILLSSFINY